MSSILLDWILLNCLSLALDIHAMILFFTPQKSVFPQTPHSFSHLSKYSSDPILNYSRTLGGIPARFKTYPKLNVMWGKM